MTKISRRVFSLGAVGGAFCLSAPFSHAEENLKEIDALKPGEFTWHPERQPEGPVSIVVSIPSQRLHLYRNGVRIAVSTVSTGKAGHETPTGVFVVLQKDKHHKSSTYSGAPMPNMNRLTWDGIALHAGKLPGYPASHGCVRLPMAFSERLFGVTHIGTPVILAGDHHDPVELLHPGPVLSGYAETEMEQAIAKQDAKLHPKDWIETEGNLFSTLIMSAADGRAELIINDKVVDAGTVSVADGAGIGEHVFVMHPSQKGGPRTWHAIAHHMDANQATPSTVSILNRVRLDRAFSRRAAEYMHPGSIMILTELPLHPEMRSAADFVILNNEQS